jgi:prevent-host-death family protein
MATAQRCVDRLLGAGSKAHPEPESTAPDSVRYNGHMTRSVTATQAKAEILRLLDEVAAGGEVEITRHGRTVARLVPATGPNALKGSMSGVAMTTSDDDDLFSTGQTWDLA